MPDFSRMNRDSRELFSNLGIIPPIFVRLDGRSFHRLSRSMGFEKPFDASFHESMTRVSQRLVSESGLNPDFAYTFSDEISLYFTTLPFSGRVEKIDSVSAAYAASALTIEFACRAPLSFDARVIAATPEYAREYLIGRQSEAWRNHINGYCQQALIEEGMTSRQAAAALRGLQAGEMHEMMHARGLNLARTPAWQRRGSLICKGTVEKEGYNPLTGETVRTNRTAVKVLDDLPLFSAPEGATLLSSLVAGL